MSNYIPINPNNFSVEEAIRHLNNNLDYLYGVSQSTGKVVQAKNLIPYSDFSIKSNLAYWVPYKNSMLTIKDSELYSYSIENIVGVISPIIEETLIPNQRFTIVLEAHTSTSDAIYNEVYLQKEDGTLLKINHDEPIAINKNETTYCIFHVDEEVSNFRVIIGSGDTVTNSEGVFKYEDLILDSVFIKDGLVLPNYNFTKGDYDDSLIPIKNTLYYMLTTKNKSFLSSIETLKKDGLVPTTLSITNKAVITSTLLETFLYYLFILELYVKGDNSLEGCENTIFNHIGKLYKDSSVKGLFPIMEGYSENSLLLSLYVLDMCNIYIPRFGNYTGEGFDLETIKASIINYVDTNYSNLFDGKFIKGAIKLNELSEATYGYLNGANNYSTSELSLIYQLELCRLLIMSNKYSDIQTICDSIFKYDLFSKSYLIPAEIKSTGVATSSSSISVAPALLYFRLLQSNQSIFTNPLDTMNNIITSINTFKTDRGFYKFDYSLDNGIYSSNQYLDKFIDGYDYLKPRDISFKVIALCEGELKDGSNLIPDNSNSDIFNKIESTINRVDLTVDSDSILAIVSTEYVKKGYLNGELSSIYKRLESAELKIKKESIIATVTDSEEWKNINQTVEGNMATLTERLNTQGAMIQTTKNAIDTKVWLEDIQSSVSSVVSIGPNIIRNSNFAIPEFRYWIVSDLTNLSIVQSSEGVTWASVDTTTDVSLTQSSYLILPKGDCNISFDAKGNGIIELILKNGDNVLTTLRVEPYIAKQRFNLAFENPSNCYPTLEVKINSHSSVSFTNIKVCIGKEDFGWSIHQDDLIDLNDILSDDFLNLSDYIDNAFKDGILTDTEISTIKYQLQLFNKEKDQWVAIYMELNNHRALQGTDALTKLIEAYSNYLNAYTSIYNYISNAVTTKVFDYDEYDVLHDTYILRLSSLSSSVQVANSTIAKYEATTSSSALKDILDNNIKDVSDAVTNLGSYVDNAFKDGILTEQEKSVLSEKVNTLIKEANDIKAQVDFYNSMITDTTNATLVALNVAFGEYNDSIVAIENKITEILKATDISQDMKYELNALIETFKTKSYNIHKALLVIADKFSSNKIDTAIGSVQQELEDVNVAIGDLSEYLETSFKDGILTIGEKSKLQSYFDVVTREKIEFDVEVDYYITHSALVGTTEKTNLQSAYSSFLTSYNLLKATLDKILAKDLVDEADALEWESNVSILNSQADAIITNINLCIQKIMMVSNDNLSNEVFDSLNGLENSVNGVLNFTDEAFKDNILTFAEAMSLNSVLENLKTDNARVLVEVDELAKNTLLANTTELADLNNSKTDYVVKYNALLEVINAIISDSNITDEERVQYKTATSNYQTALASLQLNVVKANNKVIDLSIVDAGGVTTDYVDGKVKEVQDALNSVTNLTDEAFADTLINATEKQAMKGVRDVLYKEHLDVVKQLDVYLDSVLTPEFIGNDILLELATSETALKSAYTALEVAINDIINSNIASPINKTNYNSALNTYNTKLAVVREVLKKASILLAELKANSSLNEFVDGEFSSVVKRLQNAEQKITDSSIVSTVESLSTVLVKKEYIENNYINKETIEQTYALKSQITQLDGLISAKVSSEEFKTYQGIVSDALSGISSSISSIETRVKTAELKITDDAIIAVVSSQYYKKDEVDTNIGSAVSDLGNSLQKQIDGKISTYTGTEDPSLAWTTILDKANHTGDLWYNGTSTFRWSGATWVQLTDKSLETLAQSKATIYTTTPTTPYNKGDMWVTDINGQSSIKVCATSRLSGSYVATDWVDNLKYTDDTKALEALEVALSAVKDIDIEYAQSTSSTVAPEEGWGTTAPAWENGKYIWSRTKTTLANGDISYSNVACITGADGAAGKGLQNVTEQYYLSTSKVTPTGGSWVDSPPTWSVGKYVWTRSKLDWINPTSTTYTPAVCDTSWEAVNEIEIGGRNRVKYSNKFTDILTDEWIVNEYSDYYVLSIDTTNTSWKEVSIPLWSEYNSLIGKATISFEYKESSDGILVFNFGAYNGKTRVKEISNWTVFSNFNQETRGDWKYVYFTFDVDSVNNETDANLYKIQFKKILSKTGKIEIRKPKLEIGNKPTDFSPAPEDTEQMIADIKIGGRNLLHNTGFSNGTKYWSSYSITNIAVNKDTTSKSGYSLSFTSTGGGVFQRNINSEGVTIPYDNGEKLTVSGYVKCTSIADLRVSLEGTTTKYVNPSSANTWTYFEFQFTANGTATTWTFYGVNGNSYSLKEIKVESGNKATDWTSSQKDYDDSISNVSNALNTLDKGIKDAFGDGIINDSEAKAIGSNIQVLDLEKADVDKEYTTVYSNSKLRGNAKTNLYTAKVNFDSAHTSLKSAINNAISDKVITDSERDSVNSFFNTYGARKSEYRQRLQEALDYISTAKVNDLEIGGRNLISKKNIVGRATTATFDDATNTWTITEKAGAGDVWGRGVLITGTDILVPYGRKYVLSFEIKVPRACAINLDVNNYAISGSSWGGNDNDNVANRGACDYNITKVNEWVKCWVRWENTDSRNTSKVDLYDNSHFGVVMVNETTDMTYYIRNIQGELGEKPTDWTPCDRDVNNAINDVKQSINDLANDSIITPSEKVTIKNYIATITKDKQLIDSRLTSLGIDTAFDEAYTNYQAAFVALVDYLTPFTSSMTTNSSVVRDTYNTKVANYNSAQSALDLAINNYYLQQVSNSFGDMIGGVSDDNKAIVEQAITNALIDYVHTGTFNEFLKAYNTRVEQTDKSFDYIFDTVEVDLSGNIDDLSASITELRKHITLDNGDIVLWNNNSEFSVRITNTDIRFMQSGQKIAYISNSKLFISQAEVTDSMTMGSYMWIVAPNGDLNLIYNEARTDTDTGGGGNSDS